MGLLNLKGTPEDWGEAGPKGSCGPNDIAYACSYARRAATHLRQAASHLVYGYCPDPLRTLAEDHPLLMAMRALIDFDKSTAFYANCEHEPPLFNIVTGHDPARDNAVSIETRDHIKRLNDADEEKRATVRRMYEQQPAD